MIQRIQTIWLLVASVCAFLSLTYPFYSGLKVMTDNTQQFIVLNGRENLLITILTVAVAIASLLMIFFYKDRKRQMWLTVVTAIVSLVNIGLYITEVSKFVQGSGEYSLTAVFTFVIPFFLFLAIRGIYRDNKLVKSVDRLR